MLLESCFCFAEGRRAEFWEVMLAFEIVIIVFCDVTGSLVLELTPHGSVLSIFGDGKLKIPNFPVSVTLLKFHFRQRQ